jgi:hypothetical protein
MPVYADVKTQGASAATKGFDWSIDDWVVGLERTDSEGA